uniref:ethylene-responsive transcription factor ERF011-like n=1 Tax=Erigeron canadensis TaxID=72917 RepID=UPI001CB90E56|nr:ethylene-responsive transcription factor ERF011-like [Erigeron canadensis]
METGAGADVATPCNNNNKNYPSTGKRKSDHHQRPYKGIRMRKWGKWVAEIREPNKRSRIWLGSYSTPVAAARAYDTAVYYLRGPTARLNFPELLVSSDNYECLDELSAASIRKKAIEVGTRVDAETTSLHNNNNNKSNDNQNNSNTSSSHELEFKACWFQGKPDLNKKPEPEEDPDGDSG